MDPDNDHPPEFALRRGWASGPGTRPASSCPSCSRWAFPGCLIATPGASIPWACGALVPVEGSKEKQVLALRPSSGPAPAGGQGAARRGVGPGLSTGQPRCRAQRWTANRHARRAAATAGVAAAAHDKREVTLRRGPRACPAIHGASGAAAVCPGPAHADAANRLPARRHRPSARHRCGGVGHPVRRGGRCRRGCGRACAVGTTRRACCGASSSKAEGGIDGGPGSNSAEVALIPFQTLPRQLQEFQGEFGRPHPGLFRAALSGNPPRAGSCRAT